MRIKRDDKGTLYAFLIFFAIIGIGSFNITGDWATAIGQGLAGGFAFAFVFGVGYQTGFEKGKTEGYSKAMEKVEQYIPTE